MKYPKINTIWKRDDDGKIIVGEYSKEEFSTIKNWLITEKIDGTNIRLHWIDGNLYFGGRTDKAEIPEHLFKYLETIFKRQVFKEVFGSDAEVMLFGEGYGPKIQKVGKKYRDDVSFILFDGWIDGWWLKYDGLVDIAESLGIDIVPSHGMMTIEEALGKLKTKPMSGIKKTMFYLPIEGFVATSEPLVLFRNNTPIKWKIKLKDYQKIGEVK